LRENKNHEEGLLGSKAKKGLADDKLAWEKKKYARPQVGVMMARTEQRVNQSTLRLTALIGVIFWEHDFPTHYLGSRAPLN
jgi:hypothetical protein